MSDPALQFEDQDFDGALPPEGYYAAVIERARFHTSRSGNTTLQVVCDVPRHIQLGMVTTFKVI